MDEESEMEIFERNHPAPFSKMLTFYRDKEFALEAKYSCLQDLPYPDTSIGIVFGSLFLLCLIISREKLEKRKKNSKKCYKLNAFIRRNTTAYRYAGILFV